MEQSLNSSKFRYVLDKMHNERMTPPLWGAYAIRELKGYAKPIWNGVSQEGKTILIVGEGGMGDEIFASKFSQIFVERGMRVIFMTHYWTSYNIIARIKTIDKVIHLTEIIPSNVFTGNKPFDEYDYWVPACEVPVALNLTQDQVPIDQYLYPTEEYITKWKRIIPPSDKFKIGVRWAGSPLHEKESIIPIKHFETLSNHLPNVELYSLHKDDGKDDISQESNIIPLHEENGTVWLETWDDTLAAISQLDLVISSSTSIPIVAAGLNKPVAVVVPFNRYYLWLGEKIDSELKGCKWEVSNFWFGENVKVFKQSVKNDWDTPFTHLTSELLKSI